jgi:hypothetical protein
MTSNANDCPASPLLARAVLPNPDGTWRPGLFVSAEVEVREEDDELLRAAEELGIDLSPGSLRAAARQPTAEEAEEGQERVDTDGELTLPADEQLGDVDEAKPNELVAEGEAAPADADLADLESKTEVGESEL